MSSRLKADSSKSLKQFTIKMKFTDYKGKHVSRRKETELSQKAAADEPTYDTDSDKSNLDADQSNADYSSETDDGSSGAESEDVVSPDVPYSDDVFCKKRKLSEVMDDSQPFKIKLKKINKTLAVHTKSDKNASLQSRLKQEKTIPTDRKALENTGKDEKSTDDYATIRKELAELPLGELQLVKEKLGLKVYNDIMFGMGSKNTPAKKTIIAGSHIQKPNKNSPTEVSFKTRVPKMRHVVQVKKRVVRDPRFDDLSGDYNDWLFKQSYGFISDVKLREKQKLLRTLKKEKDPEKREKIEKLIKSMTQQEKNERQREERQRREKERKKKERELVEKGKKPFFLKKSERKKIELAEKFNDLKKHGKVDTFMSKKLKQNSKKERKKLPF